ncbi:MAG: hypothetical protein K5675_06825 [Lachnospiraceae bacterium]|nr:hypothetical protein [Lachnospiraceae bacterium]
MIAFINSFLSYLILMVILLVIFICGIVIGSELRKSKNKKAEALASVEKSDVE